MKLFAATVTSLSLLASACAGANQARVASASYAPSAASSKPAQTITITRNGSQPSRQAPAQYFTGSVRIDPLFETKDPSHTSGSYVTFEPGARSAWQTHPLGQTLIVTAGTGRVQRWGDPVEEIRPGDVVWIPPGQKHWHGTSPTTAMTHIAIQGAVGGKNVDWMEKVSEEQYLSVPAIASLPLTVSSLAQTDKITVTPRSDATPRMPTLDDVRMVAPALERYTEGSLLSDLWKRPDLSPRDRSIITVAALIARNQMIEMPYHFNLALDNGVRPSEISEIITHLAFYSGWANAMSAVAIAKDVFGKREIGADQLRPQVSFFPLMRRLRRDARPLLSKMSARWLRESCSTPATYCSMTCGYVRPWRLGTGAWLPSVLSSQQGRWRNCRLTSIGQWIMA